MRHGRGILASLLGALAIVMAADVALRTGAAPDAGAALAAGAADKTRESIEVVNRRFMEAVQKGDAAAAAALYSEDGQVLAPNNDLVRGREAIRAFWQEIFDGGVRKAELESNEIETRGDVAYEVGAYALFGAEGGMIDAGKYIVIWKRSDGTWLLHRDIWNSSRPVTP